MNTYPDNLTAHEFLEQQGIVLTKHTPSFRAQLVARRTYQRPIDEAAGIYETWAQVAERVRSHQQWLWENAAKRQLTAEEHHELLIFRALVEERAAFPAGRTLWLGGTEVSRTRAASMLNCTFSEAYTIHDIVDLYWLLLQGAGTGFSPRRGALSGFLRHHKIEIIRSTRTKGDGVIGRPDNHESFRNGVWRISVGDSAEAWAKMIGKILAGKRNAHTLVIDFREVRAAGERLGNYGWISSGDAQLAASVEKLCDLMNRRVDTLLSAIDILDIVNLLGETLSSRRSAQIVLLPSDDPEADEFAMAKKDCWTNGKPHRGQSNNSLTLDRKPTKAELRGFFATMEDAGGSEPGFVNVQAALRRAPWFAGVNPCFAGDTLITTRNGAYPIRDLVGQTCDVWDGNQWVTIDNFRVTGRNQPMLRITMYDGTVLRVTPGHKMVLASGEKIEAGDLEVGDVLATCDGVEAHGTHAEPGAYIKGFLLGDGTNDASGRAMLQLYTPKSMCAARLIASANEIAPVSANTNTRLDVGFGEASGGRSLMHGISARGLHAWCAEHKTGLPADVFAWDKASKLALLAGLFDADGTAADTKNGFMYQLSSIHDGFLRDVQMLLKSLGVPSRLSLMHDAGMKAMPGGTYACAASYRLTISQTGAVALARQVKFDRLASFANKRLAYRTRSKAAVIVSIVDDGVDAEVFCCTVPTTNNVLTASGILTGQCAEQLLANGGVCNLTETVMSRFVGMLSLRAALTIIARANYRATCVNLNDGILQRRWHEINEHLHLCGVGLTGIDQWLNTYDGDPAAALRTLRTCARRAADAMAASLGLAKAKHVTTVKPSGCRPAHALTTTTEGVLTLDELFEGHADDTIWSDYVGGAQAVLHGGKTERITRTFVNGEAEVLRVRMAYGAVVESTRDHPWFVAGRGWVPAEQLAPGDVIESSIGHYTSTTPAALRSVPTTALRMRGDAAVIKQPTHMNADLAWVLGFLWGDGCMSPQCMSVCFTDGIDLTLEKVQRVMHEQFGLWADIERPAGCRVGRLTYASVHLWHWLIANDVFKLYSSDLDRIPTVVRKSSNEHIVAFIAGLCDADANIAANTRGKGVILSMASERFAAHIQDVGAAVGLMFGRSHNTKGENLQPGGKSMWLMTIGGRTLRSAGALFCKHSAKSQHVDALAPDALWVWEKESLRDLPANEIGRVVSVQSIGVQPTYDVEVENEHWFFAGIYRSHNTLSKVADCTEGVHQAIGPRVVNTIMLSAHDPLVELLRSAGYPTRPHPSLHESVLVQIPVEMPGATSRPLTAIEQLERYKLLMENWVDSNCSITVYYDKHELRGISDWLYKNWDTFVGVSFLPRVDATKTAEELGYAYLPQAVVSDEEWAKLVAGIKPVNLDADRSNELLGDDCASGACPVR